MANPGTRRPASTLWLLLSFKGRISRGTYWMAFIGLLALEFALYFQLFGAVARGETISDSFASVLFLFGLAILYGSAAISVKRLHDVGYSGFLALALLVPFLNLAFNIWIGVLPGNAGPNAYGAEADQPA